MGGKGNVMDAQEKKNILKELRKLKKAELFERLADERGHCLDGLDQVRKDIEAGRFTDIRNGLNSLMQHSLPYFEMYYNDPAVSKKMGLKKAPSRLHRVEVVLLEKVDDE